MADEPCQPWLTIDDIRGCKTCEIDGVSDDALEDGITAASAWLYRLSGRLFPGRCEGTVRPIAQCACCPGGIPGTVIGRTVHSWVVFNSDGGRYSFVGTYDVPTGRHREGVEEVLLGYRPIRDITEVLIDGDVLDPSAYRIDDSDWLVRIDGDPWPHTNDLTKATTEEGTWSVEFAWGTDPPTDGIIAARTLAVELAKDICKQPCALPPRTTNMTRQGISLTILDPTDLLDRGRFGILTVDAFLQSVNPNGNAQGSAAIVNVDLMRQVRRAPSTLGS